MKDLKINNTMNDSEVLSLHFRWTVSRGQDTYGYNIVSLLVDGYKMSSCNGGGYDMQGTCLGNWLSNVYQDRLQQIVKPVLESNPSGRDNGFHGAGIRDNGTVYLSGSAGFRSMETVANAIGIRLKWNPESNRYKNHAYYTAFVEPCPTLEPVQL